MTHGSNLTRRTILEATAGAAIVAVAGCLGAPTKASTPAATARPSGNEATTSGGDSGGMDFASRAEVKQLPTAPVDSATVEMTMVSATEPVFDPEVIWVNEGGTVTWKNVDEDPHTSNSYSSDNGKAQRIPDGASGWASGLLNTGDTFDHTFDTAGVYDYYCLPHEGLGMVAAVIVGNPDTAGQPGLAPPQDSLPTKAAAAVSSLNDRVKQVLSS